MGLCDLGPAADVVRRDLEADPDAFADAAGVPLKKNLDDLLEIGVDAVFLCTRNTVMPGVAEALIDAGVHLFIAKPIAISRKDARRYLRANDANIVATAGLLASSWEPMPTLFERATRGDLGAVQTLRYTHQHGRLKGWQSECWLRYDAVEGDAFNWLGWYPVEAITALMGPVRRSSAKAEHTLSFRKCPTS